MSDTLAAPAWIAIDSARNYEFGSSKKDAVWRYIDSFGDDDTGSMYCAPFTVNVMPPERPDVISVDIPDGVGAFVEQEEIDEVVESAS